VVFGKAIVSRIGLLTGSSTSPFRSRPKAMPPWGHPDQGPQQGKAELAFRFFPWGQADRSAAPGALQGRIHGMRREPPPASRPLSTRVVGLGFGRLGKAASQLAGSLRGQRGWGRKRDGAGLQAGSPRCWKPNIGEVDHPRGVPGPVCWHSLGNRANSRARLLDPPGQCLSFHVAVSPAPNSSRVPGRGAAALRQLGICAFW